MTLFKLICFCWFSSLLLSPFFFLPQCSHLVLSHPSKLPSSFVPQAFKHSILFLGWHNANHFLMASTHLYTALEDCGCLKGIPFICYSELHVFTDIYKNFTSHMSSRVFLRGLNNFRRVKSLLSITENA